MILSCWNMRGSPPVDKATRGFATPEIQGDELTAKVTPPERRIQAAQVRALCADISDMTLWRWINERDFPKPIYIGRRRYWREREVLVWLDEQAAPAPAFNFSGQRTE